MIEANTLELIRADFPALTNRRAGKPPVYFDNACTTLVPAPVVASMNDYYVKYPACGGGRSRHWFADEVTARLEGDGAKGTKGVRQTIQEFIGAASPKEIIFTMNTTHAINIVALGFNFKPGDAVVLTDREHNSNLVPWLRLQKMGLIKVLSVTTRPDDTFNLAGLRNILEHNRVRLVSMAFTSNLTGYTLPAAETIKLAHSFGAKVLLDGAQTVPHIPVNVKELDVDFLAFSMHKMCGPKGVGILYGKLDLLANYDNVMQPVMLGGFTVADTTYDSYGLLQPPECYEPGIQNYPGQIGSAAAVNYLQNIGMANINSHEIGLNRFLTDQLLTRYGDSRWFKIWGPQAAELRGGILTFEVKRPNALGIASELSDKNNIMVRDGLFCVHSYFNNLYGQGWTRPRPPTEHRMSYRISLYCYNTMEECRVFLDTLHEIFKERSYV